MQAQLNLPVATKPAFSVLYTLLLRFDREKIRLKPPLEPHHLQCPIKLFDGVFLCWLQWTLSQVLEGKNGLQTKKNNILKETIMSGFVKNIRRTIIIHWPQSNIFWPSPSTTSKQATCLYYFKTKEILFSGMQNARCSVILLKTIWMY